MNGLLSKIEATEGAPAAVAARPKRPLQRPSLAPARPTFKAQPKRPPGRPEPVPAKPVPPAPAVGPRPAASGAPPAAAAGAKVSPALQARPAPTPSRRGPRLEVPRVSPKETPRLEDLKPAPSAPPPEAAAPAMPAPTPTPRPPLPQTGLKTRPHLRPPLRMPRPGEVFPSQPATATEPPPKGPPPEGPAKPPPPAAPPPGGDLDEASPGRDPLAGLKDKTDLSNCLLPLLQGLGWRGDLRHVAEAVPHFIDAIDITSFRNVLANLNYESRPVSIAINDVDPRLMPCLFLPKDRDAVVLLGLENDGHVRAYDGGSGETVRLPMSREKGTAYFFSRVEEEELLPAAQKLGWFRAVAERFRGLVYQILGITLILNVLALATPLFVTAVYDKVVATGSLPTLAYFGIGVGIAMVCDGVLRIIRTRILSFVGARLDNIVGNAVLRRILFLPPAFTERATVGAQVARIKDFETVRDFFTGPMALVFFELPFTLIFVVVIGFLGGPLALVPLIMMALFALLGFVVQPLIRNSVAKAARGSSRRQELLVETLGTMRAVKYCGAEATWLERYRQASAKSALHSFYTTQYSSLVQTASSMLMTASGLATVVFGVFRVLNGNMTVGELVGAMILVWRVLAPLQIVFISVTRLTQVRSSVNQINALMNLRPERDPNRLVHPLRRLKGQVAFSRVSIRYSPEADPALVGVSFEVEPGEVVVIVGGNGSGKSTALKLLAGMYQPQAGSIRVDNQDIRQLDSVELRHAIAYVPQTFHFFYGTISQNMRLAHPVATNEDLRWAAREAGVLEDVDALAQGSGKWKRTGFEVRIGDAGAAQMPTSLLQRLNLARGYLKRAPIMLFDEPGNGLDFAGDQAFMERVTRMKGRTTVFIVTHRPSHLKLADKIIWLEAGAVRAFGPAADVRRQMPKEFL